MEAGLGGEVTQPRLSVLVGPQPRQYHV
jgi:hypothetical protein